MTADWVESFLFLSLVAFVVTCVGARPQQKDTVLRFAAASVPVWKVDVYREFDELGSLLGDKSKPIHTMQDLKQVIEASNKLWRRYLREKNNWAKKIFSKARDLPTTAIHLVGKLSDAVGQCNFKGYTDLIRAYDAAIGREDLYLEAKDQVKSAVLAAIELHGQTCRDTYYGSFKDILENQIHEHLLGLMDYLFDANFMRRVFPAENPLAIARSTRTLLAITTNGHLLLDKLVALVDKSTYKQYIGVAMNNNKATSGLKYVEPREFAAKVVRPFLIQPCEEFTSYLDDIFYPAMIDMSLDDLAIADINYKSDPKFMDIWKKFIICTTIRLNRDHVGSALEMLNVARIDQPFDNKLSTINRNP